jgi:hypothetical protein
MPGRARGDTLVGRGGAMIFYGLTGAALAVVFGLGCKKEPPPPPATPLAQALDHAAKAVEHAGQAAQEGQAAARAGGQAKQPGAVNLQQAMQMIAGANAAGPRVEPVNFRDLKALLPETLPGFKRTQAKGEKAGAMGMTIAQADADYSGDGGAHLDVKLVDIGSLAGPLGIGMAGWATVEIDRETETGYEKSTVLGGNKAFEKYDTRSKRGEIKVLVGDRFIVEVKGRNVTVDDMKAAAGKLDLAKLATLK